MIKYTIFLIISVTLALLLFNSNNILGAVFIGIPFGYATVRIKNLEDEVERLKEEIEKME